MTTYYVGQFVIIHSQTEKALNPAGMLFNRSARLQVSGSFVASTTNRFGFSDGSHCSAIASQAPRSARNLPPETQTPKAHPSETQTAVAIAEATH